jgi:hypothetical protein
MRKSSLSFPSKRASSANMSSRTFENTNKGPTVGEVNFDIFLSIPFEAFAFNAGMSAKFTHEGEP